MNPYEVLGVEQDATADEIRKRYRKLARECHPDLNPGDKVAEERFKQVSIAYDVLSDEERRAAYDEFGEVSLEAGFDADRAPAGGGKRGGSPGVRGEGERPRWPQDLD